MPDEPAAAVCAALKQLGIRYLLHRHEAVFTCEEGAAYFHSLPGIPAKCLLLKTNRHEFFLVILPCAKRLPVRALSRQLECGRLSFAKADELQNLLHLSPGSVSPFGVMHDTAGRVQVVIDDAVLADTSCQFHPNDNRATVVLGREDFLKFLHHAGHPPRVLALVEAAPGTKT